MADFTPVVTARGLTKSFVGADGERIDALSDLTLSELDALWDKAKEHEHQA